MAVMKSRILAAQKNYEVECARLEKEHAEEKRRLENMLKSNKNAAADDLVESIIGKV